MRMRVRQGWGCRLGGTEGIEEADLVPQPTAEEWFFVRFRSLRDQRFLSAFFLYDYGGPPTDPWVRCSRERGLENELVLEQYFVQWDTLLPTIMGLSLHRGRRAESLSPPSLGTLTSVPGRQNIR